MAAAARTRENVDARRQKDIMAAIREDDVVALQDIALTPEELERTLAPMGVGSLLLFCAFLGKSVEMLIKLIRKGANVYARVLTDALPLEKGDNIIHILVKRRDAKKLAEILKIKYSDGSKLIASHMLTAPNMKGNPPMFYANSATKAILDHFIPAPAITASAPLSNENYLIAKVNAGQTVSYANFKPPIRASAPPDESKLLPENIRLLEKVNRGETINQSHFAPIPADNSDEENPKPPTNGGYRRKRRSTRRRQSRRRSTRRRRA